MRVPLAALDGTGPTGQPVATIAERAATILREEVTRGALANISRSSHAWSTQRREPPGWEAVRRLNAEVGDVLETILDLLAPRTYSAAVDRAASYQDPPASVAALRAGSVMPGQTGEIRTGLRNDSGQPVDLSFVCSDLVGDAGQRIAADRIQLQPNHVRLEPGGLVRLTIALEVPANASPGLYRALLQASPLESLRALVTFPVG